MRITELLKKESIELGVKVADKNAAIDKLISLMDAGGRLNSTQGYKEGILAREALEVQPLVKELPSHTQR